MATNLDFVSLFGELSDGSYQLVTNGSNNTIAIANSANIAIASAAAVASTLAPLQVNVQAVRAAASQFAGIGLVADFATSVVNVIGPGTPEHFASQEFRDGVAKLVFQSLMAGAMAGLAATGAFPPAFTVLVAAGLAFSISGLLADFAKQVIQGEIAPASWAFKNLVSPLISFPDPLTLDLDGDGIELSPLGTAGQTGASTVFFDFDGDGFRERTGWVKADDGMLAIDLNGNGLIDNGGELFGQPARDGYEVLETYDTFADGVIDARDAAFARLRIWRDLDQDGITDAGELQTLAQAGIASISLTRNDFPGTNNGHIRGFRRSNGMQGVAQMIYFATDQRNARPNPKRGFTPAAGWPKTVACLYERRALK